MKMIELTVSGSFKTEPGTDKNRKNFGSLKVVIPDNPEKFHLTHARRMLPIVIAQDKALSKFNFEGLNKLYIDSQKEVEQDLCIAGKDIKEMDWIDLQVMACYFKLREIPLYHAGDLRTAREKAYKTYMQVIKKKNVLKSPRDIKVLKERIQRRYESGEYEQFEIDQKKEEAIKDAFNMVVNPNDPQNSYSWDKLPPLVPVPEQRARKATN